MKTYSATWPGRGSSASGVEMMTSFSHMDAHAAGVVVDEEVRRLAAKEGLTKVQMVQEYLRLQQSVFDMNTGLREAYSQPAPRDPSPRVTTTTPTGYGSGPSDHQLLDAFCSVVAERQGVPDDTALRGRVHNLPSFRRFLQRNRMGLSLDENLFGRRGRVETYQQFPTTTTAREWLSLQGMRDFPELLASSPVVVFLDVQKMVDDIAGHRQAEISTIMARKRGR